MYDYKSSHCIEWFGHNKSADPCDILDTEINSFDNKGKSFIEKSNIMTRVFVLMKKTFVKDFNVTLM